MRNMSFFETTKQARDKTKTVTRRQGWWDLKPGELVQQIEKGQGLKKGEKVKKIHVIRILSTEGQQISDMPHTDLAKEGFPEMEKWEFIEMYCDMNSTFSNADCNRIEFEYVAR